MVIDTRALQNQIMRARKKVAGRSPSSFVLERQIWSLVKMMDDSSRFRGVLKTGQKIGRKYEVSFSPRKIESGDEKKKSDRNVIMKTNSGFWKET